MSQGKITFSLGALSFSGEGEEKWLAEQLQSIIKAVPTLGAAAATAAKADGAGGDASGGNGTGGKDPGTLLSRIKAYSAESNQNKRFLAAAYWLMLKGEKELSTAKVTKALADNHQKRLGNPAQCLNSNVSSGYCEKKGKAFYITPDGLAALGHA
jgi:hypothetical protein